MSDSAAGPARRLTGFAPSAVRTGVVFTGVFTVAAVVFTAVFAPRTAVLAPQLLLHALVLLNTFPSIRIFATIQDPRDRAQRSTDVGLGLLYLGMTLTLGQAMWYPLLVMAMFALATLKYALLLGNVPHPRLLRHKIAVDIAGTLAAAVALGCTAAGYAEAAQWTWALLFAAAQLDVFLLRPLYAYHPGDGAGCLTARPGTVTSPGV